MGAVTHRDDIGLRQINHPVVAECYSCHQPHQLPAVEVDDTIYIAPPEQEDVWDDLDGIAAGWLAASGLATLMPEVTVTKIVAVSGLFPSAYLLVRGIWKITDAEGRAVEGAIDVGMAIAGGAVFAGVARIGIAGTRAAIISRWSGLPLPIRWGMPAVLIYPFAQEFLYSWSMMIRSHVLAPKISGTPFEKAFPSFQDINALNPYELQIRQEKFRQEMGDKLRELQSAQKDLLRRLDALETETPRPAEVDVKK